MKPNAEALRQHLLVLRCQTGDEAAFAELYDKFSERTLRYLNGLLGPEEAGDVHQEVWLTVFQKISTLHSVRGFRTWLYQITRHRAIDALRGMNRRAERFDEEAEELDQVDAGETVEETSGFDRTAFVNALASLPHSQRDVVLLHYWEEMSYVEIALVIGCSVGTVRSRLHYAKRKIKGKLAAAGP